MAVQHIVLCKMHPGLTTEDIQQWHQALSRLAREIPVVKEFKFGKAFLGKFDPPSGYDYGFSMIFDSSRDLQEVYQPHPLHGTYKQDIHGKYVIDNGVLVFDLETEAV